MPKKNKKRKVMTMPEPTSHTAIAAVAGANSAAAIGASTFLGVEYVVIALALLGGATALIYLARMTIGAMIASVFGSTVLGVIAAVLSTSIVIDTAVHFAPWLTNTLSNSHLAGQMLVAFLVGFLAQKGVPALFRWIDGKGGQ